MQVRSVLLVQSILVLVALASCSFAAGDSQVLPTQGPGALIPPNVAVPGTEGKGADRDQLERPQSRAPTRAQQQAPNDAAAAPAVQLPAGFQAFVFTQGLNRPTSLAFGPDGRLYIGEQSGNIIAFDNRNGTGVNRRQVSRVGGTLLGIAFRPGTRDLYASTTGRVMVARGNADGTFGAPAVLVGNLPTGRHQNDQIAFTQDGRLFYIGMGSTCDACVEKDPRNASIMRIAADGSQQQVYAHGLRNPFGLAIHPGTGELFVTDNGRDVPVSGVPDELNVVIQNGNYGWPDCWGRGQGSNCQGTIPPVAELQEHSSANGFAFYTGTNFPQDYRGNVFVALWGGNVPIPSVGKRVDRIILSRTNGQWQGTVSSFASGFDHPITVAVGPNDGALYVADHGSGQIYRILWQGQ